tara:strand:+ start:91 stop:333 length:243 start_codon:yes stop_codon:yes gene_type:complete
MSDSISKDELKDLIREVVQEFITDETALTPSQKEILNKAFHERWVRMQIEDLNSGGDGKLLPFKSLEEEEEWKKELLRTI